MSSKSEAKLASNKRSASSKTRNLILLKENVSVVRSKSANLPGVAMTRCGLLLRANDCFIVSIPPTTTTLFNPIDFPNASNCSDI